MGGRISLVVGVYQICIRPKTLLEVAHLIGMAEDEELRVALVSHLPRTSPCWRYISGRSCVLVLLWCVCMRV